MSFSLEHNEAVQLDAANGMRRHIQELKDSNRGLREQNELLRRVLLNLLKGV